MNSQIPPIDPHPDMREDRVEVLPAGKFLIESGLLFEINRRVLHPLGLALVAMQDDDGEFKISDTLFDGRHIPGGLEYDGTTLVMSEDRLFEFMDRYGVGKMQERQRAKGYIIQKSTEPRSSSSI